MKNLSEKEIENYRDQIRKLSNRGEFKKAYNLAKDLHQKFPKVIYFEYAEAVFTAEEHAGYTKSEINKRYKLAASKLRNILKKCKNVESGFRTAIRNEYYWFSKQPYKQYRLGVEAVKNGNRFAHYSQGVGAAELAQVYAREGKTALSLRWAKISEKAWLNYFKVQPKWFNSYLFYAKALGLQGKSDQMHKAFKAASKISKLPLSNEVFKEFERDVLESLKK